MGGQWRACVRPPWVDTMAVSVISMCVRPPLVDTMACMLQVGKAQHIQFDPLRAHPVSIPEGGVCVVANSLVEASKVRVCMHMRMHATTL